ncbi:WD40 repeat domain-containing protein [Streptomyces mirabilis]|uniref:WD40 repeat domain-containing protein n=1 Tax=Streptomyces mirabilis TaxID=68239 RepID=UPI003722C01D
MAFSPDSKLLALGAGDGAISLWDSATLKKTVTLSGPTKVGIEGLTDLAFSPDGKILAGATQDKAVKLWDAIRRVEIASLTFTDIGSRSDYVSQVVESIAFSPDGKTLAGSTGGGLIQLWDIATRKLTTTLDERAEDARSAAFSPDGTMLAATLDSRMGLWKLG